MSFPQPPVTGNPYAATQAAADGATPAFHSALSAALSATESVEDVQVVPSSTPAPAPTTPAATPAEAPVDPDAPRISGTPTDGWRIEARTLEDAVEAARTLGQVELHSGRRVVRGLGPWRRERFEVQARPVSAPTVLADTEPQAAAEPAAEANTAAPVPSLGEKLLAVMGEAQDATAAPEPAQPELEAPTAVQDDEDELVAPPVLPPPLPNLTGIYVPTALARVGLAAPVVADTLSLEPQTDQDWLEALTVVADEALTRRGQLDPILGGAEVHGTGAAGAAAIINAATSGAPVGSFTWRGHTQDPTAVALATAIVHALPLV